MSEPPKKPAVRPTPDEESIVQEISILLRDGRLDLGESVEEVARTLRINRRYIEAIENGHFEDLPGPVYAIGFIRSFGDHVGLDGEELVRRFKEASSSTKRPSELEFPEPIPESGVPGGAILFAGLVVAAVAYGGWYMMTEEDNILSDLVAPVPEEMADKTQVSEPDQAPSLTEESLVPVVEDSTSTQTDGETLVQQAETELEAAMDQPSEEIAEPPLAEENSTDSETLAESVEQAAEPVQETVEQAVEATEEAVESTEEAVTETAEVVTEQVSEPAEAVVETVEQVAEPTSEPEAPQSEEVEADPETPVSEPTAAEELNAAQLQQMQTGTIDAPTPEQASEPAPEPEPGPEPEPAPEPETAPAPESDPVSTSETTAGVPQSDEEVPNEPDATVAEPETPAEEPAPEPVQQASVEPNQVVIVAKEDSWVEVRDSSIDTVLMSRVLKSGERFEVPIGGSYELQTGNIGALEFYVGGEQLSSIGRDGEIGRNISLSADSLISRQGTSGR